MDNDWKRDKRQGKWLWVEPSHCVVWEDACCHKPLDSPCDIHIWGWNKRIARSLPAQQEINGWLIAGICSWFKAAAREESKSFHTKRNTWEQSAAINFFYIFFYLRQRCSRNLRHFSVGFCPNDVQAQKMPRNTAPESGAQIAAWKPGCYLGPRSLDMKTCLVGCVERTILHLGIIAISLISKRKGKPWCSPVRAWK